MTDNAPDNELARQRILQALLPSLLIAVVYIFVFQRPLNTRLNDQRTALQKAIAADPGLAVLSQKRAQIDADQKALAELSAREASIRNDLQKFSSSPSQPADPAALSALEDLLRSQGLRLLSAKVDESAPLPRTLIWLNEQQKNIPPLATTGANSSSAPPRTTASAGHNGHLWRLELAGTYNQARLALEKLSQSELPAWPLDIALAPIDLDSSLRLWTLWIWI